jgi:hypothetical protein
MNNITTTISTNLYNLISAMHDEHGSIDSRIPKKIEEMAASGKIKWQNPRNGRLAARKRESHFGFCATRSHNLFRDVLR